MYKLINPLINGDFIDLLHTIINGLIKLAIPVAVIMLIWAGVLYMISAGSDKVKQATNALKWTVVGFTVLLLSSGVIAIIQNFLGGGEQCTNFGVQDTCQNLYLCQRSTFDPGKGICVIHDEGVPSTLTELIEKLTDFSGWMFAFALAGGVIMIIVSGLSYVFARGEPAQAGKALKILIYSIVGIAIAALAWSIINIVSHFLTGKTIFATLFTSARAAVPADSIMPPNAPTGGPQTLKELLELLSTLSGWMFAFVVVAAVGTIIAGGIMYITSAGDPKRSGTATKVVIYALIGVVIAGFAWAIINVTGNLIFGKTLIPAPGGVAVW